MKTETNDESVKGTNAARTSGPGGVDLPDLFRNDPKKGNPSRTERPSRSPAPKTLREQIKDLKL